MPASLPSSDSAEELTLFRRSIETEDTTSGPPPPSLQPQLSNASSAASLPPRDISGFLRSLAQSASDVALGARASVQLPISKTISAESVVTLSAPVRHTLAQESTRQEQDDAV